MRISKESLTFDYVSETKSFYISYNANEVGTPEIRLFQYPFTWKGKYELMSDGQNSLIVFHITSSENKNPNGPVTGEVKISISGDNGFFQAFTVSVFQNFSASTSSFLSASDDLLILNWWFQQPVITYKSAGQVTLEDVIFDNPSFTSWEKLDEGIIKIYSVPDEAFQSPMRSGTIRLKNNLGTYEDIDYIQFNTIVSPVWKDIEASYSTEREYLEYRISKGMYLAPDNSTTLYRGRAYKMPTENSINININKIIEPFISNKIRPEQDFSRLQNFGNVYYLEVDGKYRQSYNLYNDWSYVPSTNFYGCGVYDDGRFHRYEVTDKDFIYSLVWNNKGYDVDHFNPFYTSIDGQTFVPYMDIDTGQILPFEACVARLDLSMLPENVTHIRTGNKEYHINRCPLDKPYWSIYYKNSYGYYEMKRVEGKVIRKHNIKGYDVVHNYKAKSTQFGTDRYMNEVTASYLCNIPLQTKAEAEDIHNLFESTEVYLKYSDDEDFIPVTVNTNTVDFKQNVRVRNYQIELISSQKELRRR